MDAAVFRDTLLVDAGMIGLLLGLGTFLRARVPLFQTLMLPAPVLAGIIGFLFGPYVFGAIAEHYSWHIGSWQVSGLPLSDYVGSYTTILIAVVFACMAIAQDFGLSRLNRSLGAFAGYGVLMSAGQVVVGMIAMIVLLRPVFDAPGAMGLVLFAGWSGGFGTSAALGDVFASNGHEEITSIAFTSATVGMMTGIVGGVILARIGTSRGHSKAFEKGKALPTSMRTGILDDDERKPIGRHSVSGGSIETLALHIAIICGVVVLGHYGQKLSAELFNAFALPLFTTAFIVGLLVRFVLRRTGGTVVIDGGTMTSLSGAASDVLIVCGMVSIVPSFVGDQWQSLLILFALGLVFNLVLGLVVAPRFLGEGWFEKQIFTWGWATGSVATGIALLRIVDPDSELGTLEEFGYAYIPLIPIEGGAAAIAPLMVLAGLSWAVVGIWGAIAVVGIWFLVVASRPRRSART